MRLLNGNAAKRPLNEQEPKPPTQTEVPKRPTWLKGEGRKEWDRVIEDVVKSGVLARIDVSLLADYCHIQGKFVDAARKGDVLTASLIAQGRALAAVCGIGPAERARLKVPSANEDEGDEKRFFGT